MVVSSASLKYSVAACTSMRSRGRPRSCSAPTLRATASSNESTGPKLMLVGGWFSGSLRTSMR